MSLTPISQAEADALCSRTNQVEIDALRSPGKGDPAARLQGLSRLCDYIDRSMPDGFLGQVEVGEVSGLGKPDFKAMRTKLNRLVWESWGQDQSRPRVIGEVYSYKRGPRAAPVFMGIGLFGPQHGPEVMPVERDQLDRAGLDKRLLALAFRAHIYRLAAQAEIANCHPVFFGELLLVPLAHNESQHKRGYINGYGVDIELNHHGVASTYLRWRSFSVRNDEEGHTNRIGEHHGLDFGITCMARGDAKEVDARRQASGRPPYFQVASDGKLKADNEAKEKHISTLMQTQFVYENWVYDQFAACLAEAGVERRSVPFLPRHTVSVPLVTEAHIPPLERVEMVVPEGPLGFEADEVPRFGDWVRDQVEDMGCTVGEVHRSQPPADHKAPLLRVSPEFGADGKGGQYGSSICSWGKSGFKAYDSFEDALKRATDPDLDFDAYTQRKLDLYKGEDFADWRPMQNMDRSTVLEAAKEVERGVARQAKKVMGQGEQDEAFQWKPVHAHSIKRVLNELAVKQFIAGLPQDLALPDRFSGEKFAGRYIAAMVRSPKGCPPRGVILPFEVTEDGVLSIARPCLYAGSTALGRGLGCGNIVITDAIRGLSRAKGSGIDRGTLPALKKLQMFLARADEAGGVSKRYQHPVHDQEMILFDAERGTLLKVVPATAWRFVPRLLGRTEPGLDYRQIAKAGQASVETYRFSRSQKTSLAHHLCLPSKYPVLVVEGRGFARVMYRMSRAQAKVERPTGLQDMLVYQGINANGEAPTLMDRPWESEILHLHLSLLTNDYLKANETSRMSLIEKMLRVLLMN